MVDGLCLVVNRFLIQIKFGLMGVVIYELVHDVVTVFGLSLQHIEMLSER